MWCQDTLLSVIPSADQRYSWFPRTEETTLRTVGQDDRGPYVSSIDSRYTYIWNSLVGSREVIVKFWIDRILNNILRCSSLVMSDCGLLLELVLPLSGRQCESFIVSGRTNFGRLSTTMTTDLLDSLSRNSFLQATSSPRLSCACMINIMSWYQTRHLSTRTLTWTSCLSFCSVVGTLTSLITLSAYRNIIISRRY
jgi:hypothetical protein